jgi:membrane protease YdiL (CAAX protease family)
MSGLMGESRRDLLRLVAVTYVAVAVAIAVAVRLLDFDLPLVGHLGSALVAVVLLYAPVFVAWRRGDDLVAYGFTSQPLGKGLAYAAVAVLVIAPAFAVGYIIFYDTVCDPSSSFHGLGLPGVCARFAGWRVQLPELDLPFAELALVQLVVVALPEELFFRGFVHEMLERAIPPSRRILGGGIGWALVISSLLFALIHLPKQGDPRALATFFPGLLFGWLRSATGSILASTLTHASSNLLVNVVEKMVLR